MQETIVVPTIEELLEKSAATEPFRTSLSEFARSQKSNDRIHHGQGNPPVKVLRAICGLLEYHPVLSIDKVEVHGHSGCSDYRGVIRVNDGEKRFRFVWNCAWKARQMGWQDYMGDPDQIRAARTFGYQCFEHFEEMTD